jgi:hypothetical protein
MRNPVQSLKAAVESAGGHMDNIVKLNTSNFRCARNPQQVHEYGGTARQHHAGNLKGSP